MTMTKPTSEQVTFTSAGAGAALRNLVDKVRENVSVKDFGAVGDGVADDAAAIQTAITAAMGKTLYFPAGTYRISSSPSNNAFGIQLGTTLTANSRWVGESATILCDAGTHRSHMAYMNCGAGFAFDIEGITFNAATKALCCIRIDSSNAASAVTATGCEFRNTLALDATGVGGFVSTSGFRCVGAFAGVTVTRCVVDSIHRLAGAGIPGTAGSAGISVGPTSTNYPRFVNVSGCRISNVTCQDTGTAATNVDCDGISISGQPLATGADYTPARSSVYGNSFVNCKGRDIKMQMDEATIYGNTSYRNILPINGGFSSINCQLTSGTITGNMVHIDPVPGSPNLSPFVQDGTTTSSSNVFAFYERVAQGRSRCITVSDNTVFNNVPEAVGVLNTVVVTTDGHSAATEPMYATITSNKIAGGACDYFGLVGLRASGEAAAYHSICDNSVTKLLLAFLGGSATSPPFDKNFFALHGNRHSSAAVRHLVNTSAPTTYYGSNISAFNNTNIGLLDEASFYTSERNRPNAIIPRLRVIGDPDTNEGGIIAVQSVVLADDAEYAFPYRGYVGFGSLRIITGSTGDNASCVFRHGSSTTTSISAGANVSLGTSSNPDVDGNVNIWSSATNIISIKNRLGSSRVFTLYTFG